MAMLRKGLALSLIVSLALPLRAEEPELAPLAPAPKKALKAPPWLRKNKRGTLVVKSKIAGASVFVDGLEVGTTPLEALLLPPGKHDVRLAKKGYLDSSQRVTIRSAKRTTVLLDLKDAPEALPDLPLPPLVAPPPPPPLAIAKSEPPPPAKAAEEPLPPLPAPPLPTPPLPSPPLVVAEAKPPPPPAPPPAVAATEPVRPTVPVEALTVPAEQPPLTQRWYFWGGAAAAAVLVAAGVAYALPARYVEKRDPTAACAGPCVVVNR